MTFFSNFPYLNYDFSARGDKTPIVEWVPDTTTKVSMNFSIDDIENLCERYLVNLGELPENISQAYYETPDLAWTISYINGIGNLNNEWPLTDIEVMKYTKEKYGVSEVNTVHHYEKLPENIIMDQAFIISQYGAAYVLPVTNFEYETNINEYKRMIYIIKPPLIAKFVSAYLAQMK